MDNKASLEDLKNQVKEEIQEIKHDELNPHQHPEEGTIQDEIRPAAYARVLAVLPKYATRAMDAARPLAYASEVGESFRKVVPWLVKPLYALSIGYVASDIGIKLITQRHQNTNFKKWYLCDLSLWHLGASLLLPALIINRWVHVLAYALAKAKAGKVLIKYVPSLTALGLIPFIVHPIDHATDHIMDITFRKYVNYKDFDPTVEISKESLNKIEKLEKKVEQKLEEGKKH